MKTYRNGETSVTLPLVILIVVLAIGGYLYWKQGAQAGAINSVSDLDAATKQLDQTDVDGLGTEFSQMDADASSF